MSAQINTVSRRPAFWHGSASNVAPGLICRVQDTEVHWSRSARVLHEVAADVPSIHMAWDGRHVLSVDDHALRLDEDVLLVLNPRHIVSSRARRDTSACVLSVYFAPRLLHQALERLGADAALLRSLQPDPGSFDFFEHLRDRDRSLASVMRYIAHHADSGLDETAWYEEQIAFLLERLLANELTIAKRIAGLACKKVWRRRETFQRLSRVTDLIHCQYERQFTMAELAAAAHWSPFHMMREFKAAHGISPYEFLQRRRTQVALHMLQTTDHTVAEIAESVGFVERSTMIRRLRSLHGLGPRAVRALQREASKAAQSEAALPTKRTNARWPVALVET